MATQVEAMAVMEKLRLDLVKLHSFNNLATNKRRRFSLRYTGCDLQHSFNTSAKMQLHISWRLLVFHACVNQL
jgi:hypothetical protein